MACCRQGQHPFLASGQLQTGLPASPKAGRHDARSGSSRGSKHLPADGCADHLESCGGNVCRGGQDAADHPAPAVAAGVAARCRRRNLTWSLTICSNTSPR